MWCLCFWLQVSSVERTRFSTESTEFWNVTTDLLKEVNRLHGEVDDILCPCNNEKCPFSSRGRPTAAETVEEEIFGRGCSISVRERRRPRSASPVTPPLGRATTSPRLEWMRWSSDSLHQDCEVTEEPLGKSTGFVRSSPLRRARRRLGHASLVASSSCPSPMNYLMVPSNLESSAKFSHSLPSNLSSFL